MGWEGARLVVMQGGGGRSRTATPFGLTVRLHEPLSDRFADGVERGLSEASRIHHFHCS